MSAHAPASPSGRAGTRVGAVVIALPPCTCAPRLSNPKPENTGGRRPTGALGSVSDVARDDTPEADLARLCRAQSSALVGLPLRRRRLAHKAEHPSSDPLR